MPVDERSWQIHVCPECGHVKQFPDFCRSCGHKGEYTSIPVVPAARAAELEAALTPFLSAANAWENTNRLKWDEPASSEFTSEEEWYAEIEVCNRDVSAARAALKGKGLDDG